MPLIRQERPAQPKALGARGLTLGPQQHRESGSSGAAKKNYIVRAQEAPTPGRATSSLLSRAFSCLCILGAEGAVMVRVLASILQLRPLHGRNLGL